MPEVEVNIIPHTTFPPKELKSMAAAPATGRRIERMRSANGQTLLFNPKAVPEEVVEELHAVYGFTTKPANGCLADIMISQRKGEFPPVAFMLITRKNRHVAMEELIDRLEKAGKAFQHHFAIVIGAYPYVHELQMLHLKRQLKVKIFSASTYSSATKLMMAVREKHSFQLKERAKALYEQMESDLLTRDHALAVLHFNMPFLTRDECDMLLDMFGTISAIANATAAEILDKTVLNAEAAQAVEEFFTTEYVVD